MSLRLGYTREELLTKSTCDIDAPEGLTAIPEAIELIAQERRKIHLLIADVVMPGMGGPELSSRVAGLLPSIRTLFISGYAQQALESRGTLPRGARLLQKPFDKGSLLTVVRSLLDS